MLRAMTGRSPKGITAQGNTLGVSSLTNWRAVSAKGASEMLGRPSFCSFRAQVSSFNITQGAAPGLYSYWAFSPSLLTTSTVVWCHGLYSYWAFSPSLPATSTVVWCHKLYAYWAFSPPLPATSTVVWCHELYAYWAFSPPLQRANPFFKIKQQNFKQNEVAERNISYRSNGRTRTDTDVSWKYKKISSVVKKYLAKFVSFVER